MESLLDLVKFCRRFTYIVCYGAGDFSCRTTIYLKKQGINIDCYCISDDNPDYKYHLGVPLVGIKYLNSVYRDFDTGIIVAVNETSHSEIQEVLLQEKFSHIFFITNDTAEILSRLEGYSRDVFFLWILYNEPIVPLPVRNEEYERRIEDIRDRFDRVEIRYFSGSIAMLCAELMYYYDGDLREDHRFFLLYPANIEPKFHKSFQEPNSFLVECFCGDYFEALSCQNLAFWKYFIQTYPGFFEGNLSNQLEESIKPKQMKQFWNKGYYAKKKCYVEFTQSEKEKGDDFIKTYLPCEKFICIFARSSAYYKRIFGINDHGIDVMDVYRNSDIENFGVLVDAFYDKKICSVRMGNCVDRPFERNGCFDKASTLRDDFIDVYLNSRCLFFIGDSSGAALIRELFSKPAVFINIAALTEENDIQFPGSFQRDLMILQKYWDVKKKRYLTLKEMFFIESEGLQMPFDGRFNKALNVFLNYQKRGILPVKNTPGEIFDVAMEMYEIVNGTIKYDALDEMLQDRFHELVVGHAKFQDNWWYPPMRVGAKFLRENQWLLQ